MCDDKIEIKNSIMIFNS